MGSSRNRVFLWVGVAVVLNSLLLAAMNFSVSGVVRESIVMGLIFGSLFGHTSVAAGWAALGPGRLTWRVPLSLLWLALPIGALAINPRIHGGSGNFVVVMIALVLGQWLLSQLPLWALVIRQGIRLRYKDETDQLVDVRERQFGLRQLILMTALIGVILGIGRLAAPLIVHRFEIPKNDLFIVAFLIVAQVILSLPLLLAALLQKRSLLAVQLALLLIALATVWEHQLLQLLVGPSPSVVNHLFIAINSGTALISLVLLTTVRLNGYRLAVL